MLDLEPLRPLLRAALEEDLGPGDITSDLLVPRGARARGRLGAKAAGVLAGLPVALEVLRIAAGPSLAVRAEKSDGSSLSPGDVVLELEGDARGLLAGERTALNFIQRLSGIATLARRFVDAVAGTGATILDTRKTTPGLRTLERYAVRCGGASNHRFALYDAVLVKENHLLFGADLGVALAARPAGMPAIVEAESLDQFRAAMEAGADVVMLDDCLPEDVEKARSMRGGRPRPLIEVSGGITLDNVRAWAEAGAERISIGALTHSAPALDMSLKLSSS